MVTLIGPLIAAWVAVFMLSLIVGPPQAHAGCWSIDTGGANPNTRFICTNGVGTICDGDPTPCLPQLDGCALCKCFPVGDKCDLGSNEGPRPQLTGEQKREFDQLARASAQQCEWLNRTVLGLKPDQIKPAIRKAVRNCNEQTTAFKRLVNDPQKPEWKVLPIFHRIDIPTVRGSSIYLDNRDARDFNQWATTYEESSGYFDIAVEGFERGLTARDFPQCSLDFAFRQAHEADANLKRAMDAAAKEVTLRLAITLSGLDAATQEVWDRFVANEGGVTVDLPDSLIIDAFAAVPLPASCSLPTNQGD